MKAKTFAIILTAALLALSQPGLARDSNYNSRAGGNGNGQGGATSNVTAHVGPAPSVGNSLMGLIFAGVAWGIGRRRLISRTP